MSVTIEANVPNAHKACVTRHLRNIFLCWSYLTWSWPWPLLSRRYILIWYLFHPLIGILAKCRLAVAISSISVTDSTKKEDFDLILTWVVNCFMQLQNILKQYSLRTFYFRLSHLATANGSQVGDWEGICLPFSGARSVEYPSGAWVS